MWPQKNATAWFNFKTLVNYSLPQVIAPEPIDPKIITEHEENLLKIGEADATLRKIVEQMDTILSEKNKLDTRLASLNKWHNQTSTMAEKERIERQLNECKEAKKNAQAMLDILIRVDYPLVKKIQENKVSLEKYASYIQLCEKSRVQERSLYEAS